MLACPGGAELLWNPRRIPSKELPKLAWPACSTHVTNHAFPPKPLPKRTLVDPNTPTGRSAPASRQGIATKVLKDNGMREKVPQSMRNKAACKMQCPIAAHARAGQVM